jgi:ArsR family transcriptional regulator, arsenate/arsenite/antimonite-responsive transcriptional repressor
MTEILEFTKALSDPNRLRMIGLLSQNQATPSEIAAQLDIPAKETLRHLTYLQQVGVVTQIQNKYSLNNNKLATIAKDKLSELRPTYIPDENLDEKAKKVLKAHLYPDGSIREIPAPPKLQIILNYLINFFEFDKNYTEKEINTLIKRFNIDTAGLRRDLVDTQMLARESDGSRYWRVK